jgi:hypothetical protein
MATRRYLKILCSVTNGTHRAIANFLWIRPFRKDEQPLRAGPCIAEGPARSLSHSLVYAIRGVRSGYGRARLYGTAAADLRRTLYA